MTLYINLSFQNGSPNTDLHLGVEFLFELSKDRPTVMHATPYRYHDKKVLRYQINTHLSSLSESDFVV